jgi:hypothetical protein
MKGLAERLGIEFQESLVTPYADLETKMVDGIFEASTPMGDTRLLDRRRIDPSAADHWRGDDVEPPLSEMTRDLARSFGYVYPQQDERSMTGSQRRTFAAQSRNRRARTRTRPDPT